MLALAVCYRDACEKSKRRNGEEERAWGDRGQMQPGNGRRHEHPPRTPGPGESPVLPGGSAMTWHLCCSHAFSVFPSRSLLCSGICSRVRKRHPVHTLNVTNGNRRGSFIDHLPLSGSCCRVPGPCGTAGFPFHPHPRGCFLLGALQKTGRHLLLAHPGLLVPGGPAHLFHPSCWEAGRQREPAPGVGTVLCL